MSVFILWAWILRVHLIATHMITWPASCQPPITSRTGPTKKQTADGLLPSDPQTSAPKIRAGKIHMFTICKFGPFPETIFQKNVVETWEWQNNFSWGEMKMGDGRADFSLFPKDPGSRILFVWDRHARSHEKTKGGCCETIALYGCPPLKQICSCTSATGGLNVAGGTGNLAECCHSMCLEDVEGFKHVQTKKRSNHEGRSILISLTAKRRKLFPTRKKTKNAAATWCTCNSMVSVWPEFWINIYILRNVWRTCQGVHRKTK